MTPDLAMPARRAALRQGLIGLVLALFHVTAATAAALKPGASTLDYGFFCALEPVAAEAASDTVSGSVQLVDGLPVFLERGPRVPAQLGIGLGVLVTTLPRYAGPVTIAVEHPPMGPDGVTRQTWITQLSSEATGYVGYSFEYDYEVLPGRWTVTAQADGRIVFSVGFEVIRPPAIAAVDCGRYVPLS